MNDFIYNNSGIREGRASNYFANNEKYEISKN